MIIVLWKTSDKREHHMTFGRAEEPTSNSEINEAEKFCKKIWQDSAVKEDKAYTIESMTVFDGTHMSWEKEETKIVNKFKLKRQ
jgi:hypothetical protein